MTLADQEACAWTGSKRVPVRCTKQIRDRGIKSLQSRCGGIACPRLTKPTLNATEVPAGLFCHAQLPGQMLSAFSGLRLRQGVGGIQAFEPSLNLLVGNRSLRLQARQGCVDARELSFRERHLILCKRLVLIHA